MKLRLVCAAVTSLLGLGCSTQGGGTGELESGASAGAVRSASPVTFTWHSDGPSATRGTMTAFVQGHGEFEGKYMQVTSEGDLVEAEPFFAEDWDPGWEAWDGWGPEGYGETFATYYTGKVIAVLRSEAGDAMRCRFRLAEPEAGPAGGGIGECELPDGEKVTDVVLEGR